MHSVTRCRFCSSEIPLAAYRKGFCNSECKRLYMTYGSYSNWKGGIKLPRTSGSRKTGRKQTNTSPNNKKARQQAHSASGSTTEPKMVPVQAGNGKVYTQYILVMDYPEDAPPTLTGGAINIAVGGNNAKKRG